MRFVAFCILILYWLALFVMFSGILSSPLSSYSITEPNLSENYDPSADIDTGGFLGGIFGDVVGTAASIAKFFVLAVVGMILPVGTPSWVQWIFSVWQFFMTLITAAVIVSFFWEG